MHDGLVSERDRRPDYCLNFNEKLIAVQARRHVKKLSLITSLMVRRQPFCTATLILLPTLRCSTSSALLMRLISSTDAPG